MSYETIKIEKAKQSCPACELYAEKHYTTPPRIAILACEGACAKGEVARLAANLVAHELAKERTVRICLGAAFTKDTGQRSLVRRADKTIAIEGCYIACSSRMMKGVLPGLNPEIVQADALYEASLPFGIDEVSDEAVKKCARIVAETIVREYIFDPAFGGNKSSCEGTASFKAKESNSGCCKK
jgi:uncharacterized metal-binding protein